MSYGAAGACWAQDFVIAPPGDAEALEVFSKLVGPLPEA
jgi:hypothetical protein